MSDDITCDYCESAVEDLGLCLAHLNEELDYQLDEIEDPWPDFHDELSGVWDLSDLSDGWADR